MTAITIPDPLPPWITPDRQVIAFFLDQDLDEFGDHSLVARTWQWVLHGGGGAQKALCSRYALLMYRPPHKTG
jgi:hypothetical protein